METMTKPALRGTDRLRQRVAALARLLDETMNDIQTVDAEFEQSGAALERRTNLQMNAAVQAVRSELIAERTILGQEIEELKQAKAAWETERLQLVTEVRRANQMLDQ